MREGCIAYCFSLPSLFFCFCFGFSFSKPTFTRTPKLHLGTHSSRFFYNILSISSQNREANIFPQHPYIWPLHKKTFSLFHHVSVSKAFYSISLFPKFCKFINYLIYIHTHEGSNTCSNVFSSYVHMITC
jgi:hypothetical protein